MSRYSRTLGSETTQSNETIFMIGIAKPAVTTSVVEKLVAVTGVATRVI